MYPILRTYGYHEILSLNFSFIATLISITAILLNGIFIPIIWNEIGNVWREFDQEISQIKEMEQSTWADIRKFPIQLTRTARRAGRQQLWSDPRRLLTVGHDYAYLGSPLPDKFWRVTRRQDYADAVPLPKQELGQCSCDALNNCPRGPPGPKGAVGIKGEPGVDGTDGRDGADYVVISHPTRKHTCAYCPPGAPGVPGPPGSQGPRGLRGPAGKNGCMGKNGAPGNAGDIGLPGPDGPPGPRGIIGPPGDDAVTEIGKKGLKGQPGQVGLPGPPGDPGTPNLQIGRVGLPGAPGPRGEPGKPGLMGPKGYEGYAGEYGESIKYCPCPKDFLKETEMTESYKPPSDDRPPYAAVTTFPDHKVNALVLGARGFETKNSSGIFEIHRHAITSSDIERAFAPGSVLSQPLPIDQKENQLHQTSDAFLQVTTESVTKSNSYKPSSTYATIIGPASIRTTYFYVTTTPYPINSVASTWQQNLQHSTMASEATTMTSPITELARIASHSTSETSLMQQTIRPLKVPSLNSAANMSTNYASSTVAEPSAKQPFLKEMTTVSIESPTTPTLISDEKSNTDLDALTHLPELQRTTIVQSRDDRRDKTIATPLPQSTDVPTKVDNKAGSTKINSTAISSTRIGQIRRLPYTLRQLLQQEKLPESPSHANQESIDHKRPSGFETAQVDTLALHSKGKVPLFEEFSPSQENQGSSGKFETFEYNSKESEIEELASQLESDETNDDESRGQDIAEVVEELKRKSNVWKTSKEKVPALGSVPLSERHQISPPRANLPNQIWMQFLQDLIKDGYNVKSRLFGRIKGGREGIIQRLAQELVELNRDQEFESITARINDDEDEKIFEPQWVPLTRAMNRRKLPIRKIRLFAPKTTTSSIIDWSSTTTIRPSTRRKPHMEGRIAHRPAPRRGALPLLFGTRRPADYGIPADTFSKGGQPPPIPQAPNLIGRL